jgi:protein SCO1/2
MSKRKWAISAAITVTLIWAGLLVALKTAENYLNRNHRPQIVQQAAWTAPAFAFPDQDNHRVSNTDLLGHVWIADFIFTQCTSACPILTSKMLLLQKQLKQPDIRFISFSVDPEHDSPAVLKQYARLWEGDESRWRLLSTDPNGLAAVAAGMKVTVAKSDDKDNPILHSSLFLLIDKTGNVYNIYDSIDNAALTQLVDDATYLAGESNGSNTGVIASGSTPIQRGQALFGSMGCVACHSQPRVAPLLQSVYGSIVRLDDRKMVWADDAYLHESIVDPNAKVVAGYARTMPNYHSYLSDQQVMDLVAYIKSLSSNSPGGHGMVSASATQADAPELLIDPVCKMQVTADSFAPHAVVDGKTYYFCSDHCREQFLKKPAEYTLTKTPAK